MSTIVNMQEWVELQPQKSQANKQLFLSEEEVRALPQFKDASPEEVENIIGTIHDLALITYELFCREYNEFSENKRVDKAA